MSDRKGGQAGNRRRTITSPEPSPHLADLSLQELRAYRERLNREEEKASYWRRLVHARREGALLGPGAQQPAHLRGPVGEEETPAQVVAERVVVERAPDRPQDGQRPHWTCGGDGVPKTTPLP